jgi:nucleoid DNA-binding protein
MSTPSTEEALDALVAVLRDELAQERSVEVPELGTFCVEHQPATVDTSDKGSRLLPPRNTVGFAPETD